MAMSSNRPYLVRAFYEWIVDNRCTPYLLVDAHGKGVSVPQNFVNKDGQIVLNVSPTAVRDLHMGGDAVTFNARFGGLPTDIYVPCSSILAIYARENGQGMIFEADDHREPPPQGPKNEGPSQSAKRPSLRVVK